MKYVAENGSHMEQITGNGSQFVQIITLKTH